MSLLIPVRSAGQVAQSPAHSAERSARSTISVVTIGSGAIGANAIGRMWPRGSTRRPAGAAAASSATVASERAACDLDASDCQRDAARCLRRAGASRPAASGPRRGVRPQAGADRRTRRQPDAPRPLVCPSLRSQGHGDHDDETDGRRDRLKLPPERGRATSACAVSRRRGPGTPHPHRRSSGRGRRRRSPRRFAVHSYAYPTDASFFFSRRRASETRHFTVPTGMPSIEPICSYE